MQDILLEFHDGLHATPKPAENGPVFLGIKNITIDGRLDLSEVRHIAEDDFSKWTKRVLPLPGDIVFSYEATLNLYAIIPEGFRGCLGRRLALIRPNMEKINTRFLFYYFFGAEWRKTISKYKISGATVDRIPLIAFPKFQISLPPLEVQRKIAAILSAYDDLIENNTRRIKILEEMAQMIYREWFVHFRFPGHEKVKMVDSPLGKIPEGWEVSKIENLYNTASGGTPSRKIDAYFNGSINWIKTQELQDGFVFETDEKITETGLQNSSAKVFPMNSVIIAMYGATIGKLGILAEQASTNQACCALLQKHKAFGHAYGFLTLLERRKDIIGLRMGAAQQNISQVVIKNFQILSPSEQILEDFNNIVNPMFDLIRDLQRKNQNLRRTRDLLLPKLISGEVEVEDIEVRAPKEEIG